MEGDGGALYDDSWRIEGALNEAADAHNADTFGVDAPVGGRPPATKTPCLRDRRRQTETDARAVTDGAANGAYLSLLFVV